MIVHNGNIVVNNGRWINPPPPPPTRTVHLVQTTGGTISAQPLTGYDGTTVTLSHSEDQYYTFMGYTVNGSTLYGNNKFDFSGSDVTVTGQFEFAHQYLCDYTTIANRIWTANNLAYDDGGPGIYKVNSIIVKEYPDSSVTRSWDIGPVYYYNCEAAERVAAKFPGWRLPTQADVDSLINATMTLYQLGSTYGWRAVNNRQPGSNTLNFNLKGSGYYNISNDLVIAKGERYYMCTSIHGTNWWNVAYIRYSGSTFDYDTFSGNINSGAAFPIRLVKDNTVPPVCV